MAPSFDTLSDHDFQEDDIEDEIDFSDLREQYDVRMEEGLDTFCVRSGDWGSNVSNWRLQQVIDGLPIVNTEQKPKLIKFLLRKLNSVGHTREDAIFMPMNDKGSSEGCVVR
jgi:translation initiation factor 3 subunit B